MVAALETSTDCPSLTDCWASRRSTRPRASLCLGATSASARSGSSSQGASSGAPWGRRSRVGVARRPGLDRAPACRRREGRRRGHHGRIPDQERWSTPTAVPGADPALGGAGSCSSSTKRTWRAWGLSRRDGTRAAPPGSLSRNASGIGCPGCWLGCSVRWPRRDRSLPSTVPRPEQRRCRYRRLPPPSLAAVCDGQVPVRAGF